MQHLVFAPPDYLNLQPEVAKAVASWSKESVIPETSLAHFRGFGSAPEKKSSGKQSLEGEEYGKAQRVMVV